MWWMQVILTRGYAEVMGRIAYAIRFDCDNPRAVARQITHGGGLVSTEVMQKAQQAVREFNGQYTMVTRLQ